MKGASDKHPVTEKETTHGTTDGRKACLHHCLTYVATHAIVAGLGARALGIRVHAAAAAAALAVSLGIHYAADRRVPGKGLLEKLADKTGPGRRGPVLLWGFRAVWQLRSPGRQLPGMPGPVPGESACSPAGGPATGEGDTLVVGGTPSRLAVLQDGRCRPPWRSRRDGFGPARRKALPGLPVLHGPPVLAAWVYELGAGPAPPWRPLNSWSQPPARRFLALALRAACTRSARRLGRL
ncbi:hypothetical protein ACSHWO_34910 [Streptomyces sp. HUAS TT3]|uniref:hypothetical protein n=1 Tax=Streptomyces sp. HUAS TT3 TaxID=3447510 RepID=UPI003F65F353